MLWPKLFVTCLQSEEDQALKQQLELYVERVQDVDPAIQKMALEAMR
jgi:26S proteasome regulatory subunit N1